MMVPTWNKDMVLINRAISTRDVNNKIFVNY